MASLLSALVGQMIGPATKKPGTGAERQRRYKARYIAEHGKEAWDTRARTFRKAREAKQKEKKSCKE